MTSTTSRRTHCVCIFRTKPWQPHDQRCPMHRADTCPCDCHLAHAVTPRGHSCGPSHG